MRSPFRVLLPLLWMGLIALGSSDVLADDNTGRLVLTLLGQLAPWASPATLAAIHFGLRKLGHLVEYGILAILWHRALSPGPRGTATALVLAVAYGALDELWQGAHPRRTPALGDVVIDAGGALLGLLAWTGGGLWRKGLRAGARSLAGLAGLVVLALGIDATLGRPVAALGATAVGLALVAGGLAHLGRARRITWRNRR